MTLTEWLSAVESELDVPPADMRLILDVARDVARGIERPAAPLTTYLLGVAVGRSGADATAVADRIRALLPPTEPAL